VPHRWKVHLTVSTAVFVAALDLFIVNVAFPDLARDFAGASLGDLSWVLNAYTIVFAALLVPAGRLADRTGRKRAFLAGLALFGAGSMLCAAAPTVETLVAARVVQAAGAAVLLPTSLGLMLPEFPPAQRPVAIAAWATVSGVAAAAGPPLGGLLVDIGWRWIFVVNLPVVLVALAVGGRLLRESRDAAQARPDWAGTLLLIAGVGGVAFALVRSEAWGLGDGRTLATLAAAAGVLALFADRSRRHPAPVVDPELLRISPLAAANAATLLFFVPFAAMLVGTVWLATAVWGESVLHAGLMLAPGPLMATLLSLPGSRLAARHGPAAVAALGALLFAAGFGWWLLFVEATPSYAGGLLPGLVIGGGGVGLALPTLAAAATAALPPGRFATGAGIHQMSRQLGTVLGVALFVAVLGAPAAADRLAAIEGTWVLMGALSLVAGAAALAVGRAAPEAAPAVAVAGTEA
jgi:EmrB/QacA subfamily drug resistance transporter